MFYIRIYNNSGCFSIKFEKIMGVFLIWIWNKWKYLKLFKVYLMYYAEFYIHK